MGIVFMYPGETVTAVSNGEFFGQTGKERILIPSGVTGLKMDANIGIVEFSGNTSDYTYTATPGGGLVISLGGTPIMTLPSLNAQGTMKFGNGSVPVSQGSGGTFKIGSGTVDNTGTFAVNAGDVNNGDVSTVSSASTYRQMNVGDPQAGGSQDAGSLDITFTFQDVTQNISYTVSNFGSGEVLDFSGVTPTVVNSSSTDGIIQLQRVSGSYVTTITLTGVSAGADAAVYNVASFRTYFGTQSLLTNTFTVYVDGEKDVTFHGSDAGDTGGTAAGEITLSLSGNTMTYARGAVTAETTTNLTTFGKIELAPNQVLTLSAAEATSLTSSHTSGNTITPTVTGPGKLNIEESTITANTSLISMASVGDIVFEAVFSAGLIESSATTITVESGVTLWIPPEHASGLTFTGAGIVGIPTSASNNTGISVTISTAGDASSISLGGTSGADTIDGSASTGALNFSETNGNDSLTGGSAGDTIRGGSGDDLLTGNAGADSLLGGDGNDSLDGGGGNDSLDGGSGTDRAIYSFTASGSAVSFDASALTDATATTNLADGSGGTDSLIRVEQLGITGSTHGDSITGSGLADEISGGGAGDVISCGGGDDTVSGDAGDDSLDGGSGTDTALYDFSAVTGPITFDASALKTAATLASFGDGLGDTDNLINFERLEITGSTGADSLRGSALADSIRGGDGDDTLTGGDGIDTLAGGADNDTFVVNDFTDADILTDFTAAADRLVLDVGAENLKTTGGAGTKPAHNVFATSPGSAAVGYGTTATLLNIIDKGGAIHAYGVSKAIGSAAALTPNKLWSATTYAALSQLQAALGLVNAAGAQGAVPVQGVVLGRVNNTLYALAVSDADGSAGMGHYVVKNTYTLAKVGAAFAYDDIFLM